MLPPSRSFKICPFLVASVVPADCRGCLSSYVFFCLFVWCFFLWNDTSESERPTWPPSGALPVSLCRRFSFIRKFHLGEATVMPVRPAFWCPHLMSCVAPAPAVMSAVNQQSRRGTASSSQPDWNVISDWECKVVVVFKSVYQTWTHPLVLFFFVNDFSCRSKLHAMSLNADSNQRLRPRVTSFVSQMQQEKNTLSIFADC